MFPRYFTDQIVLTTGPKDNGESSLMAVFNLSDNLDH